MKIYKLFFIILFVFNFVALIAQEKKEIKKPLEFFPKEKAKILVVGTFHFDYPGLDVIKTDEKNKIDVLKEPKKTEITELINYIKKFKPTKIAIEARTEWNATEKFKNYKAGNSREKRDERYQIGFRIAQELNLDTIYSIDAPSFDDELAKLDTLYFKKLFKDYDFKSNDPLDEMYNKWSTYDDEIQAKTNLLKYFKYMNSREVHNITFGSYLIGDFKLDKGRGADILSIWWYNRNLRIFRKLQEMTSNNKDRILVIFGNGHASILRQLLECSPEYEFIEFNSIK